MQNVIRSSGSCSPQATASLLRSTSGFDGAGATGPVLVLAAWAIAGACAATFGRASISSHSPAPGTLDTATSPTAVQSRELSPANR